MSNYMSAKSLNFNLLDNDESNFNCQNNLQNYINQIDITNLNKYKKALNDADDVLSDAIRISESLDAKKIIKRMKIEYFDQKNEMEVLIYKNAITQTLTKSGFDKETANELTIKITKSSPNVNIIIKVLKDTGFDNKTAKNLANDILNKFNKEIAKEVKAIKLTTQKALINAGVKADVAKQMANKTIGNIKLIPSTPKSSVSTPKTSVSTPKTSVSTPKTSISPKPAPKSSVSPKPASKAKVDVLKDTQKELIKAGIDPKIAKLMGVKISSSVKQIKTSETKKDIKKDIISIQKTTEKALIKAGINPNDAKKMAKQVSHNIDKNIQKKSGLYKVPTKTITNNKTIMKAIKKDSPQTISKTISKVIPKAGSKITSQITKAAKQIVKKPIKELKNLGRTVKKSISTGSKKISSKVSKELKKLGKSSKSVSQIKKAIKKAPKSVSKELKKLGKSSKSVSQIKKAIKKAPKSVSKELKKLGKSSKSVSQIKKAIKKAPKSVSKELKKLGKSSKSVSQIKKALKKAPKTVSKELKKLGKSSKSVSQIKKALKKVSKKVSKKSSTSVKTKAKNVMRNLGLDKRTVSIVAEKNDLAIERAMRKANQIAMRKASTIIKKALGKTENINSMYNKILNRVNYIDSSKLMDNLDSNINKEQVQQAVDKIMQSMVILGKQINNISGPVHPNYKEFMVKLTKLIDDDRKVIDLVSKIINNQKVKHLLEFEGFNNDDNDKLDEHFMDIVQDNILESFNESEHFSEDSKHQLKNIGIQLAILIMIITIIWIIYRLYNSRYN